MLLQCLPPKRKSQYRHQSCRSGVLLLLLHPHAAVGLPSRLSISQLRWALSWRAAGNLMSLGTPTRSLRYAAASTMGGPTSSDPGPEGWLVVICRKKT
jgi:hypothetical protein